MSDVIVWAIVLAFYAPLHYLGPLLVGMLTGRETPMARKRLLIGVAVDCTASMTIAFMLALCLFSDRIQIAMLVLLISLAVPYLHIAIARRRRP